MRVFHAALALTAASGLAVATPADSKGCIRGALVGGVAGHYAGHHGLAGAAAGCVAGHMYYKHKARQTHAVAHHR